MSSMREGDLSSSSSLPLRDKELACVIGARGVGGVAGRGGGGGGEAVRREVRPNVAREGDGRRARRNAVAIKPWQETPPARLSRDMCLIP